MMMMMVVTVTIMVVIAVVEHDLLVRSGGHRRLCVLYDLPVIECDPYPSSKVDRAF